MKLKLIVLILAVWISGCTNAPLKKMQTQGVPTSELMAGTSNAENNLHKVRLQDDANYSSYSRNSATEIDFLFPRLPNPTLVMYVFPHMSPSGVPVPGYSTAFPLFEKTEYALPGEM